MKIEIQTVPESILNKANDIMTDKNYSNKLRRDLIKSIISTCVVCGQLCSKIIVSKDNEVKVIQRFCDLHFEQKYKKHSKKKRRKVKLG